MTTTAVARRPARVVNVDDIPPPANRRAHRNGLRTPEMIESICEYVRQGHTYTVAAEANGVSYQALTLWRRKGKAAKSGWYRDLYLALLKASAEGRAQLEKYAFDGAAKDGKVAIMILERRYRKDWGKQPNPHVSFTLPPDAMRRLRDDHADVIDVTPPDDDLLDDDD